MERREIDTGKIHSFLIESERIESEKTLAALGEYDYLKVPPIPVFEIPEDLRTDGLEYALPDGNSRWLFGHVTSGKVLAIVFQPGETIDVEDLGMAPFRNAANPKLYEKTIGIYCFQKGVARKVEATIEAKIG